MAADIVSGQTGALVREGFGERSIERRSETGSALVEMARAQVQSRYIVAMQRPRNWDQVRVRLIGECRRPGFAAVAKYSKPIGKGKFATGASIRFAEAAMRHMGNLEHSTQVIGDTPTERTIRVSVCDLESNTTYSEDVVITKVVERSDAGDRVVLSERRNSRGAASYLVQATDDELLTKIGALESKALRECVLRLLPGDIHDEAMDVVDQTRQTSAAKDPGAERRALVDAFASVGVMPTELERFIGHALEQVVPVELVELRSAFAALRDRETTWTALVENKLAERAAKSKGGGDGAEAGAASSPNPSAAAPAAAPPSSTPVSSAPTTPPPGSAPAGPGGMTPDEQAFALLYERIEHAAGLRALQTLAGEINKAPERHRGELWAIYSTRKKDFQQQGGGQ